MNKLFYCYLICLSFFSCTDTFDEDKYSLGEKQLYLLVSEGNMVFNYEGGNSMIEIEGNSLWYAKVEGKFVTLSKNKGGNNSKRFNEIIDVKVHPNPFAANRKAQIQIYNDANDSLVATINIEQSLNEEEMNKYEVVDLGLSVKWATKNFDLSSNANIQGLYGWGDSTGCLTDSLESYAQGHVSSISGTKYDVVSQTWGPVWRIPTQKEFQELIDNCKCEYKEIDSLECIVFSRNGCELIIPFSMTRTGTDICYEERYVSTITAGMMAAGQEPSWSQTCFYWTGDSNKDDCAQAFAIHKKGKRKSEYWGLNGSIVSFSYPVEDIQFSFLEKKRYIGLAIRPVRN